MGLLFLEQRSSLSRIRAIQREENPFEGVEENWAVLFHFHFSWVLFSLFRWVTDVVN